MEKKKLHASEENLFAPNDRTGLYLNSVMPFLNDRSCKQIF